MRVEFFAGKFGGLVAVGIFVASLAGLDAVGVFNKSALPTVAHLNSAISLDNLVVSQIILSPTFRLTPGRIAASRNVFGIAACANVNVSAAPIASAENPTIRLLFIKFPFLFGFGQLRDFTLGIAFWTGAI